MKFAWLTDIHLNFLDVNARSEFYDSVIATHCDFVLITGDIAEAPSISDILEEMSNHIKRPIYFVLGNHDYYQGQISEVQQEMIALTQSEKHLFWMPSSGPQVLEKDTILLGQDGWADGRYGDYENSRVALNDSRLIADLFQEQIIGKYPLLEKMQALADQDAEQLRHNLIDSIKQYHPKKLIVLTHVPPFKEACLYEGKMSGDEFLPFFSSKATGDVLIEAARDNPDSEFLVLCGHTHAKAEHQPLGNLTVKVGRAEYYHPEVLELKF